MKRIYIWFLIFVLSILTANAQTVSESTAHSRAEAFFATQATNAPGRGNSAQSASLTLAYTSQGNGNTRFYVYNRGENDGFVIIGGDESVQEILAYSNQGHFDSTLSNPNLKWWVETTEQGINRALRANARYQSAGGDGTHVDPLLTTQWGQDDPYNALTPIASLGDSTWHCPTGCVATAMAQVLNYHQYPSAGIGTCYYWKIGLSSAPFEVDLSTMQFDWSNMKDNYKNGYTQAEKDAVATLMYACGASVQMEYGANESGASDIKIAQALRNNFGYTASNAEFSLETIKSELLARNPLIYCGGTHCMVIDGYDAQNLVHLNMGWDGQGDGYYALNNMNGYASNGKVFVVQKPSENDPNYLNVTIGDVVYNLFGGSHTAYVEYASNNMISSIIVPPFVEYNGQFYDVIRLDNSCFENYAELSSVILPEGLEEIGDYAFMGCKTLTEINIPNTVKKIEVQAFSYTGIQRIVLPAGLEQLSPFIYCSSLSEIVLDSRNPYYEYHGGAIYNRAQKTMIAVVPQYGQPLYIKPGTTAIGDFAATATNIPEFIFPSSIKKIGAGAFYGNPRLKRVVLPDSCETVRCAFHTNDSLEYMYVPKSVGFLDISGHIQWGAEMSHCPNLQEIEISPENPYYTVIGNQVYSKDTLILYKSTVNTSDSVFLPTKTQFVDESAFSYCRMKYIDISHIEGFDDLVFSNCKNLETINIPEGIRFIPGSEFFNCSNLKELTLPSTLLGILGVPAFGNCNKLLFVNCNFTQPFTIIDEYSQTCVFPVNGILTVPQGTKSVFENAEGWKDFTIVEKAENPLVGEIDSIKISASRPYLLAENDSIQLSVEVLPDSSLVDKITFASLVNYVTIDSSGVVKARDGNGGFQVQIYAIATDGSQKFDTTSVRLVLPWETYKVMVYIDDELVKEGAVYKADYDANHDDVIRKYVLNNIDTTMTDMTFEGWTITPVYWISGEPDIHYISVSGHFHPNRCQITFTDEKGAVLQRDTIEYGQTPIYRGATPEAGMTDYNYAFAGWTPTITEATTNAEYHATYTIDNCTLIASYWSDSIKWSLCEDSVLAVYGTGSFEQENDKPYIYNEVKTVYVSDGITGIGVGGLTYQNLTTVYLPNSLKVIDTIAFRGCQHLGDIIIPAGVTSIKSQAFRFSSIAHVDFSEGLLDIEDAAFEYCTYLSNIELPASLLNIGDNAFGWCYNLQSITCHSTTPPSLGANVFDQVYSNIPVYVPCGTAEAYRSDPGWSYFTNIIERKYKLNISSEYGYTILQAPNCDNDTAIIYVEVSWIFGDYIFDHWSDRNTDNPRTIVLNSDTTLTAYFAPGYYITFRDSYGNELQNCQVKAGEMPVYTGPTPTQEGGDCYYYEFSGWSPDLQPAYGDASYYAQFDLRYYKYNVVFQDYDGTILQQDSVECGNWGYYNGVTPTRPSTAQYSFWFTGWSPNPNDMWVNEDKVYVAQYDSIVNQYTITVSGENCTTTGDGTYDYGTEVTLTVTPDEGYRFTEWSDGVPEAIRQIIVVEDATYIAHTEMQSIETGQQENSLSEQVQKIFDGTNYYILRGGKRYTMQGAEVK